MHITSLSNRFEQLSFAWLFASVSSSAVDVHTTVGGGGYITGVATWFRRPEQMRPKRLGELSVREKADRCISCSAETSLEGVDDGRINDTLIKANNNNTLREKVTSHIQTTSAFGYLG